MFYSVQAWAYFNLRHSALAASVTKPLHTLEKFMHVLKEFHNDRSLLKTSSATRAAEQFE